MSLLKTLLEKLYQLLKNNLKENNNILSSLGSETITKPQKPEAFLLACKIIKEFEGLSLKAYQCSAGVWTIGYGNTSYLKQFDKPQNITISQEKADELLEIDITTFYNGVCETVGLICNNNQIASLTSFAFNIGLGAFKKSTLVKTIQIDPKQYDLITVQFLRWNKAGGKVINGLVKRRQREAELYCRH